MIILSGQEMFILISISKELNGLTTEVDVDGEEQFTLKTE